MKGWVFAASAGGIIVCSILYYHIVIPDESGSPWFGMPKAMRKWSIVQWTGATAEIKDRDGGFDESYGFKRTLEVTFPEDTLAARVKNHSSNT